jgi:hypothetical protein
MNLKFQRTSHDKYFYINFKTGSSLLHLLNVKFLEKGAHFWLIKIIT